MVLRSPEEAAGRARRAACDLPGTMIPLLVGDNSGARRVPLLAKLRHGRSSSSGSSRCRCSNSGSSREHTQRRARNHASPHVFILTAVRLPKTQSISQAINNQSTNQPIDRAVITPARCVTLGNISRQTPFPPCSHVHTNPPSPLSWLSAYTCT